MKVFKFGGASVKDVEGIQNVAKIIQHFSNEPLMVVISAMGKTTNALEAVVNAYYQQKKEEALQLFEQVKNQHNTIAKYLLVKEANATNARLNDFYTEVEWLLHDKPVRDYDYYYDQIVSIGELLSTTIVNAYLSELNIPTQWLDVRDYFRTDNNFRDANIDLDYTTAQIKSIDFKKANVTITQGFIGCTSENESTTLGREGSDYSAAIIASIVAAESVSIWKDVEGVLSGDPKQFADAQLLPHLSYNEVIEMAYYGAQVIHPKTIKPLYNANIPLLVKCFNDINIPGTVINNDKDQPLPPIKVVKQLQTMIHLQSKDYSFVGEKPIAFLYEKLAAIKIKPNLIQTGAISVTICLDHNDSKIEQLAFAVADIFEVMLQKDLSIITVRHYTTDAVENLIGNRSVLLSQKTEQTYQAVVQ